jgi:dienelactone hydrolase
MRKTFTNFLVMTTIVLTSSLSIQAQNVFKTTSTSTIGYLEYLPADYNSNSNKYPVVIFLHGIGERGPNTTDIAKLEAAIWSVDNIGPPRHAKDGTQFPFILISPQLKDNYSNWPSSYVMEVINHVKTYLRIDERKIHISGLSLGGYGAWTVLQDYPKLFASASPVCGGWNDKSKACGIAAENVPVWAFHGDKDTVVPMSVSSNMVNAINACTPTPSPLAKLTIYTNVAHDAWNKAYAPNHTYHNPNVYEWLMTYTNTVNAGNKIPVASAGSDISVTSSSVSLTGTATDDGTISAYSWKKISGASVTMTNASSKTLSLSGLANGTYMFKMTVTDNSGNTDSDYVKITVNISSNVAPVANAGSDVNISYPTTSATLNGTGTDADGSIVSYTWRNVSGPSTATLSNSTSASVSVSNLSTGGTYVLSLTVTDNNGATATDNVSIKVNQTPVANAGSDRSITLPTSTISLTGSGSDPDGSITGYKWSFSKGPVSPTLSNATSTTVSISGLTVAGQYVFAIKVTDNYGLVDYDHITVNVLPSTTTASVLSEGTTVVADNAALETRISDDVDFYATGTEYWSDKVVNIYDGNGATLYAGEWTADKFEQVFNQTGLYIYKVFSKSAGAITGKMMIRK